MSLNFILNYKYMGKIFMSITIIIGLMMIVPCQSFSNDIERQRLDNKGYSIGEITNDNICNTDEIEAELSISEYKIEYLRLLLIISLITIIFFVIIFTILLIYIHCVKEKNNL